MPTYDFQCEACEVYFTLFLEEASDLGTVNCPDCHSKDCSVEGYDAFASPKLFELQKRITELEVKVMRLTEKKLPKKTDLN